MATRRGTVNPSDGTAGGVFTGSTYAGGVAPGTVTGYIIRADQGIPAGANEALAQLKAVFREWGLDSLAGWAWDQLVQGKSADQIVLDVRNQAAYRTRFAAIIERQAKGLAPISEAEVVQYERQAAQLMRANGMPAGFYDQPADFTRFLSNDVSLSELNSRVTYAKRIAGDDPSVLPEEAKALRDLYGLGDSDLAAYMLDPGRALPLIEKQIAAAANAARARVAGFGDLNVAQAERVSALTSSIEQAAQGFQQLARMRELWNPLPGEAGADQIDNGTLIEAQFGGSADAQAKVSRRQRARQAAFDAQQGDFSKGLGSSSKVGL